MATKKTHNKSKPVPMYFGIQNVVTPAQKKRVDALVDTIKKLFEKDSTVQFSGRRRYGIVDNKTTNIWQITSLTVSRSSAAGDRGAGTFWIDSEPEHIGVLRACERVLETYDVPVQKLADFPEDMIDLHTEAKTTLIYLLSLPCALSCLELLQYVLWFRQQHPDSTCQALCESRPNGLYNSTLAGRIANLLSRLPRCVLDACIQQFEQGKDRKPRHVYALHFSPSYTRRVSALPEVFFDWLNKHGEDRPTQFQFSDLWQEANDAGDVDQRERLTYITPGSFLDVIIHKDEASNALVFTYADPARSQNDDPFVTWRDESLAVPTESAPTDV